MSSAAPKGLKSSIGFFSYLMLGVSIFHAASGLWNPHQSQGMQVAMVVTVVALLGSSHRFADMAGTAYARSKFMVLIIAFFCILLLESFSVYTSAKALTGREYQAARAENTTSDEYQMALSSANSYQKQIEALQVTVDKLDPVRSRTAKLRASNEITKLQDRKRQAMNDMKNVDVSTSAASARSMESSTGLSSNDMALLAAIMLSVAGIGLRICYTSLFSEAPEVAQTVKKHQREPLRAVS